MRLNDADRLINVHDQRYRRLHPQRDPHDLPGQSDLDAEIMRGSKSTDDTLPLEGLPAEQLPPESPEYDRARPN